MHILIIILLILFLVPTIILSFVSWVLSLFGFRSRKKCHRTGGGFYYTSNTAHDSRTAEQEHKQKEKKKLFDKDEGEYVDFEEIK